MATSNRRSSFGRRNEQGGEPIKSDNVFHNFHGGARMIRSAIRTNHRSRRLESGPARSDAGCTIPSFQSSSKVYKILHGSTDFVDHGYPAMVALLATMMAVSVGLGLLGLRRYAPGCENESDALRKLSPIGFCRYDSESMAVAVAQQVSEDCIESAVVVPTCSLR